MKVKICILCTLYIYIFRFQMFFINLMNRLNKTESAIFISLFRLGYSWGIGFLPEFLFVCMVCQISNHSVHKMWTKIVFPLPCIIQNTVFVFIISTFSWLNGNQRIVFFYIRMVFLLQYFMALFYRMHIGFPEDNFALTKTTMK